MKKLLCSLGAGCVFAFSTLMMIQSPVLSSVAVFAWIERLFSVLLVPGLIIGIIASGNIHVYDTSTVTLANFIFYSGFIYLLLTIWSNFKARSQRDSESHDRGHSNTHTYNPQK
jgi:hypothetical protein